MSRASAIFVGLVLTTGCAHMRHQQTAGKVEEEFSQSALTDAQGAHTTGPRGAAASAAGREARPYATQHAGHDNAPSGKRWYQSQRKADEQRLAHDLAQAESLAGAGKLDDARKIYQQLIVDFPQAPLPLHSLALVADRQRKHREAQTLYVQALQMRPREAEWLNDLGWSYYLDGQLEKAESALNKAVALAPSKPRYHNNLGLVLGHLRRYPQALEEFRRAGSEADAQYNLAFVLTSQDDVAGAKRCFQLALAADPSYSRARDALRAFDQYEQDPASAALASLDPKQWVPYVEDPAAASAVAPAGHIATQQVPSAVVQAGYQSPMQPAAVATPLGNGPAVGTAHGSNIDGGTTSTIRSPVEGINGPGGRLLQASGLR